MENNIVVLVFDEDPARVSKAFKEPTQAENMLENVLLWQERGIIEMEDAVTAYRGESGPIEIKQTQSLAGKYSLRGSGIGLLAGVLLGGPIGGLVAGSAIGAISGKLKDIGIDDKFIKKLTEGMHPNSSALFLLGKSPDPEAFMKEITPFKATVAMTTLPEEREKALRAALKREQ